MDTNATATGRADTRRGFVTSSGVAATGIAGLSGCLGIGFGRRSDEAEDEIVFYNAGSLEYDPGTAANIDRFESETGISVDVNEVPWNNLKTSLTTIWRNEDGTVDVWNGPSWWLDDFVRSGWLEPLDLPNEHVEKFPDDLVSLMTFDGEVYMAPQFGKWGTYLYDKHSVSAPPETWDDVLELEVPDQSEFGFTWADKDVFMFKQFLYQAGGRMFNEDDEPRFHGRAGRDVMEFIVALRERGKIPVGMASMSEGNLNDAFLAGQFATVNAWTPLGANALEYDRWGESRLGSARLPEGPGGSRATFQDTNGLSISAYSERKPAAMRFVEFMTSRESCKHDMLVEGNPCVVPDVYDDDDVHDAYPSHLLETMQYNLEHAMGETYIAQAQVDDYLSTQITDVLVNDKDPQRALEQAHDDVEALYQEIGIL
ncbi:ABC transporter substrate-binding protein [Natronosalvus caseinilyticus]|uniref:ABC transporter substrate-binding protein n=1 Tax=Natronosalvus caseinilyticus TaxID=2953747 RepID=UPI0028AE891A|nr:extracellular solute-binding protein [Natronosalvus caseinilyticus]